MHPMVVSIQVGKPRKLGREGAIEPMDRPWESAIFKSPVVGPVWLGKENLQGDGQADPKHHGGPERAVLAYAEEHYTFWRHALNLPDMTEGSLGENFVVAGITEKDVCIGDVYSIGEALIQVSQPRLPCWKLARRWKVKDLALQAQITGRTGWFFRVLKEGFVEPGQALDLVDRPYPEWTVEAVNSIRHSRDVSNETLLRLASCPLLADSWRAALVAKANGATENVEGRVIGNNR
jgi:MOSC domain-containing protein YiiM